MSIATLDKEEVRQRADGRWREIIAALTGIPLSRLNKKNQPCPKCGGTDRFSLVDETRGALLCRKCFHENNGDGFAAIMWWTGEDFSTVLRKVADYLNITPATGRKPEPRRDDKPDPAKQLEFREWDNETERIAKRWADSKGCISIESIRANGGRIARYQRRLDVVALPAHGPRLGDADPVAWTIWNVMPPTPGDPNSEMVPRSAKNPTTGEWEEADPVKVKQTAGSRKGLVGLSGLQQIDSVHDVIITEGPTDMLALWSVMSETERELFTVISTTNGASCNLDEWMLDLLAGKDVVVVYDADDAGMSGAAKHYRVLKPKTSSVRVLKLPYSDDSKQDARDFLNEGYSFADLMALEQVDVSELHCDTAPQSNQELSEIENGCGQQFEKAVEAIAFVDGEMKQSHDAKRIGIDHQKNGDGKTVLQTLRYAKPDQCVLYVPIKLVDNYWNIAEASESNPLADYEQIERKVDELIESESFPNIYDPEIRIPLTYLKRDDPPRFAKIRQKLQNTRRKFSTQTFDRLINSELANLKKTAAGTPADIEERYFVAGGVNCKRQKSPHGESFVVQLANFEARIIREITITDGVEQYKAFLIVGRMWNGRSLSEITIKSDEFLGLNWIVREWGYEPTVWPQHRLDFAASVQCTSRDVELSQTFRHTGWYLNESKKWVYLSKSGELGSTGIDPSTQVELNSPLDKYDLPEPPGGQKQIDAARKVLRLLDLGPARIMFPALAAPHIAVFGQSRHSMFFYGATGTLKTALLGLLQQFFGPEMTADCLPGSWNSTAFALQEKCFY